MIDLHTHVLPGLDDGAQDLEASVAIAEQAAADGVHTLVATPHIREDFDVSPGEIGARAAALEGHLRERGVGVRVLPGGEVAMTRVADLDDEQLRMVSIAGGTNYVLLETPYGGVPPSFEEVVFALQVRGYTALIAHPERSETFQERPERLSQLVERGALLQVTAAALTGGLGRDVGRLALDLVQRGDAHVIATDVHRATGRRSSLAEARLALERRGLGELGEWMTVAMPERIAAGEPPVPAPATRSRGRLAGLRRLVRR
jgi:protein-tyrosine phosphatase